MSRYPELGAPFSAIHQNLEELDSRQNRLLECRLAHLEEWAKVAVRVGGEERDILLRLLDSLRPEREFSPDPHVPPENRDALCQFYRQFSAAERLCVLRTVLEQCGMDIFTDSEGADTSELSEHAADKIAYVQNTFSDTAYLQFSNTLRHPRAAYFDSFSGVCEEVYNGICEYCILPILHQRDGKLFRFYALLEKYELRIVCTCDIPWTEKNGVTTTRYALIRKHLPPLPSPEAAAEMSHLELLLPADDAVSLCELLQVAELCRLSPERVDTRTDEDSPGVLTHQITLRLHDADLCTFLAYLTLDVPRCTVLGLYCVLET